MDISNLTDHEKAMIAKSQGQNAPIDSDASVGDPPAAPPATPQDPPADPPASENNTAERPDWCPEEFWDAEKGEANTEALARKYAELAAPKKEGAEGEEPAEPATPADKPFVLAVDQANADLLENDGKLRDETYEKFEEIGLSREHVDGWIEGQRAKAELIQMRVFGEVGGSENLTRMIEWGVNNYTESEREMFDKMMNSGDVEQALSATRALEARYSKAEGKAGALVTPQGQANASPGGYTSKDEVVADMRKPEYRSNKAFREQVQQKIAASIKSGVDLGF